MRLLANGARGADVCHLQRLLNQDSLANAVFNNDLREDGVFGPRTLARLQQFQRGQTLPPTGQTDARTWHNLGQLIEIDHNVVLFPQPTDQSCWSAAATMLFGDRSVGPGHALFGTGHMIEASQANVQTFLRDAGLRFYPPSNWTIGGLIGMLRNGPMWAAGRWSGGTQRGGHVVVISAVWSNQTQDNGGTTFRIHDPWPPGHGAIYGARYDGTTFMSLSRTGTSFNAGMIALAQR